MTAIVAIEVRMAEIVSNEEVRIAVLVEVLPRDAEAPAGVSDIQAGFRRGISEGPLTGFDRVVAQKNVVAAVAGIVQRRRLSDAAGDGFRRIIGAGVDVQVAV